MKMNPLIPAASLILRTARAALAPAVPPYLIFFVTHRCNAACAFCFDRTYDTSGLGPELSLDEIERIAASWRGVIQVTLTGGEPFLREDLADVAGAWARAGMRSLTLATNGILTDRIVDTVRGLLASWPGLMLDLNISIDGPAPLHDRLRTVEGAWEAAMATAAALAPLQQQHPLFRLGATLTVSAFNPAVAVETVRALLADGRFRRVQAVWVRGRPFDPSALAADFGIYEQCVKELERQRGGPAAGRVKAALARLTRETVARTVREDRMILPCRAGGSLVELDAFGRVYPCEMLWQTRPEGAPGQGIDSWVLGSLRETGYSIRTVMASPRAQKVRAWVRDTGCYCSFECAAYANVVFNPRQWPRALTRVFAGGE